MSEPRTIPLHHLHESLGGRFAEFAGYSMPMRYEAGAMAEHLHTRSSASLFDVSHMGVLTLSGTGAADALERLVPSSIRELQPGRNRYTFLLNESGGIIDDLMVTNRGDHIQLVVNAGTKDGDLAHLRGHIGAAVEVSDLIPAAILALQGPEAVAVLAEAAPGAADLAFSHGALLSIDGADTWASRSGYTGEDGFELIMEPDAAEAVARKLLSDDRVGVAGLAARDSLRLEAGLCLYGHDLTPEITPIEAGLTWALQKRRREEGGFLGAAVIQHQLAHGTDRMRIGFVGDKRPVREGSTLHLADGTEVGWVTSGTFGPSADRPVGMGYVGSAHTAVGTALVAGQRGKEVPVVVSQLPFVPHRYAR
jgi:aminomethyltransferase